MVVEMLSLMPAGVAGCSLGVAVALALAGGVLWLLGATFDRSLLTLGLVAAGTVIGLRLPGWCGWSVDGMGPAIGAAVVLGASGYLLHRTYVGVGLGATLALWGGLIAWAASGSPALSFRGEEMSAGPTPFDQTVVDWVVGLWQALPQGLNHALPAACAAGFATGVLLAVFRPLLSRALACSLIGTTLLVAMGGVAMREARPQLLLAVPGTLPGQMAVVCALALSGAAFQWWLIAPAARPRGARPEGPVADASIPV